MNGCDVRSGRRELGKREPRSSNERSLRNIVEKLEPITKEYGF
jgi:hypothetical protein